MKHDGEELSRRELLVRGGWLALGAAGIGFACDLLAAELSTLDVAYAGSMGSLMEGPIKSTLAKRLNLEMDGRAQGSSAIPTRLDSLGGATEIAREVQIRREK